MDFDSKGANAKKYKNKQRYNKHPNKKDNKEKTDITNKSKKQVEDDLPSNWSRYELSNSEDEDGTNNEKDQFNSLLDKPITQGSYFKFKNEENWSKTVEFHSHFQTYFTLDVNLLNAGVACVKFTERHRFNDELLQTLDSESNTVTATEKYEQLLNKINFKKISEDPIEYKNEVKHIEEKLTKQKLEKPLKPNVKLSDNDKNLDEKNTLKTCSDFMDDVLDSLLQDDSKVNIEPKKDEVNHESKQERPIANNPSNTTEDLEQWLDDILDD